MNKLQNLIEEAKNNVVSPEFTWDNIVNLDPSSLNKLSRENMVLLFQSMAKYDKIGFAAYLGEKSTPEQVDAAVVSIEYKKKNSGGRKYPGGWQYTVIIDHSKLTHDEKDYHNNAPLWSHQVIVTPRKYRGVPEHWLLTNIFDGKKA